MAQQQLVTRATAAEIAQEFRLLFVADLGRPPPEWREALPLYTEVVGHLPRYLLHLAIMRHIATSPWFPKPCQILDHVAEEWSAQMADKRTAARLPAPREPDRPAPTAEQIARVHALVNGAVRRLNGG